ncbi:MAG: Wzz/FepE/Etk N-terminal domain-containing protein [Pseudomonadota bacterium]
MAQIDRWDDSATAESARASVPMRVRPRISTVDLALRLLRSWLLMLLVFLPIAAGGIYLAMQVEETYTAEATLLISPGDENIFRPTVGDQLPASAILPDTLELIQTELEILGSPRIIKAVLPAFGIDTLYPKLLEEEKAASSKLTAEQKQDRLERLAEDAFSRNYSSWTAPESKVITVTFTHEDRLLSESVLAALIDQYLKYRVDVLAQGRSDVLTENRTDFESQLQQAEDDIQNFLLEQGIIDFEAERAAVQSLFATVNDELFANRSRQSVVRGQIDVLEIQLTATEPQIDIFVEDSSAEALTDLQVQREQLLSRYTPESRPVQAIDRQIEQVKAFLDQQEGVSGTTRRGPNPVYQNLQNNLNSLRPEFQALTLQRAELEAQKKGIEARQMKISKIAPEYQELIRRRDLLEQNVRSLAEKEVEALSLQQNTERATDNIQILKPAEAPLDGKSLKLPIALGAIILAGFTALMIGLFVAFSRKTFATARSLEKTLGTPVLATVAKARGR